MKITYLLVLCTLGRKNHNLRNTCSGLPEWRKHVRLYRYSMEDTNATIDTIAQRCGLSRTTVSAVLRGDAARYRISAATADRVRAMAEAQDWRPNFFARSLNRKGTDTIGVLFPDVFERFMGETVRGIEDALTAADFRMLLSTSRFDPEEELRAIQAFAYRGVDGLIIAPYAPFRHPGLQANVPGMDQRQPMPEPAPLIKAIGATCCVLIDRVPESLEPLPAAYGVVVQADRAAAMKATLALAKAAGNNETIGFAGFDLAASSLRERRAGYRQAAQRLGFEPVEILLYERNPASKDLERALDSTLPRTRAWIASTEGIGLKLAALLTKRGYRIGENAWVARFGTDPPFLPTPLVSLRQPHYKLGFQAAELLLSLMGKGIGGLNTVAPNANIKLRTELEMELVLPEKGGNAYIPRSPG